MFLHLRRALLSNESPKVGETGMFHRWVKKQGNSIWATPYGMQTAAKKCGVAGVVSVQARKLGGPHQEVVFQSIPINCTTILQGISQSLVHLSQCMEQLGAWPAQSEPLPQPTVGSQWRHSSPVASGASSGLEYEHGMNPGCKGKQRPKWWRSKKWAHSREEGDSESSDKDTAHRDGN